MSQANADRNLLFGMLALQMDFITRDQLVGAMQDWVFDKTKSLGAILVKKGVLAEDTHALLEGLVKKHLAQHSNDPEKSLAAIRTVDPVKEDLKQLADADLQTSLGHVVTGVLPVAGGDPFATRAPLVGEVSSSSLRFRILRPHARGGLGEVLVARDEELRREVALKQIQDRHADNPDSQARFMLEAEITGGLEHPGIVPVYGLGHYADGRPYYAMRFIRGDSLKDACESFHKADVSGRDPGERSLELRSLLGRFVDVCNAIAYAHSRGVLHRDLKPGNIMLGKYGETLVVDWGLAKPLDAPAGTASTEPGEGTLQPSSASMASHTLMGSAVGTPQFMSPEQAAGRLDLLGPASDVYSLGATLYVILAGKPAFMDKELGSLLMKVQNGQFPHPREVKANIPAALEAICLKAMALKPNERYASPRIMAEDIEHWLADEPVSAWVEPWTVKARRWIGRHRALVTGAASAVVVAVVGLAAATVLLTAANQRERAAKELAVKNEIEAKNQRDEADRQRKIAEHNHQLARQAVDRYHTEVSEDVLLHEPGMQPLRKKLLGAAREYYEKFVAERGNEPGLEAELGKALFRLAQITGEIDSEPKAIALHEKAQKIFAALVAAEPQSAAWQTDLAKTWHHIGRLHKDADELRQAESAYAQALSLWDSLLAAHPKESFYRAESARSRLGLGNVYAKTNRVEKARDLYEKALETRLKLSEENPKAAEAERDVAITMMNLARVFSELAGQEKKAEPMFREAAGKEEKLVREYPHISRYKDDLAMTHFNLGDLYGKWRQKDDAEREYQKAASQWEELVRLHPSVSGFASKLAESYVALGSVYGASKQFAKAEESVNKALALKPKLADTHKDVSSYQDELARSYTQLGNVYRAAGQGPQAEKTYEEARTILERLIADKQSTPDRHVPHYEADLARNYNGLGLLQSDERIKGKAEEAFRKALALWQKLNRTDPKALEYAVGLSTACTNLGNLLHNNGNSRGGLDWYASALKPLEILSSDQYGETTVAMALSKAHWYRAEALDSLGNSGEALEDWTAALKYAPAKSDRAWIRLHRTVTMARAGKHADAVAEAGLIAPGLGKSGEAFYELVRAYALAIKAAGGDSALPQNARDSLVEQYGLRALELLEGARAVGFFQTTANLERLRKDAELAPLRAREDFRKLLSDVEQKAKSAS